MSATSSHRFPLNIDAFVKQEFWLHISRLAAVQRQHPQLYGQIEQELEWVDVSRYKSAPDMALSVVEISLHRMVGFLESSANGIPANGFQPKTYVIPFRGSLPGEVVYYGGIPEDVCLIRVYTPWPYPKYSLRDEHLSAQAFYSDQLAEHPLARREKFRTKLLHYRASGISFMKVSSFIKH